MISYANRKCASHLWIFNSDLFNSMYYDVYYQGIIYIAKVQYSNTDIAGRKWNVRISNYNRSQAAIRNALSSTIHGIRNWPITIECEKNNRLWLINFLLLLLTPCIVDDTHNRKQDTKVEVYPTPYVLCSTSCNLL